MSEIIRGRLKDSIGKRIIVFLMNNFRFEGKLTNYDSHYLEILDSRTNSYKTILLTEIKELEIKDE